MTHQYILSLSDVQATLETVGGKGASLARLTQAGLPVPGGFHVTTAAYKQFVAENDLQPRILAALESVDVSQLSTLETASRAIYDLFRQANMPQDIADAIAHAYAALGNLQSPIPNTQPVVAVRSSATAEDLPGLSFAGQQDTYLNIQGISNVLDAVKRCWASLWTARAIGYRAQHTIDQNAVSLAVVVQMLVHAEAAGILFTANPVTGQRDQAMLTAAWGLGEAIVGGEVTPDILTVDKATGRVLTRETADKQVMTVQSASGTEQQPVPEDLRRAPVLSDKQAAELTRLGVQIEQLYQMPMDIEWTLALPFPRGRETGLPQPSVGGGEGSFAIVQARPITALPPCPATLEEGREEPEAPVSIEWTLPDPKGRFMRGGIVELLPNPLSPLFATLGLSAILDGVEVMVKGLLKAPREMLPADYVLTIQGYAYMKISYTAKEWGLMLFYMLPAMPRMIREGVSYWRDVALPRYAEVVDRWSAKPLADMTASQILVGVREVLDGFAHHLGALMASTMGPSAGSEGLFTQVYEKMIKRPDEPPATIFLLGFDSIPVQADKALWDLAVWCRERAGLAAYLVATPGEQIAARLTTELPPIGIPAEDWQELEHRFRQHLDRYGSSIYDMDFYAPLPVDNPGPILETLRLFISGMAQNPYQRQQASVEQRDQAAQAVSSRLKGLKRWAFDKALRWAQSQVPLREDGIAKIGLGYPQLRAMLLELGRRFAAAGLIEQPDDIFWLEQAEVEAAAAVLDQRQALTSAMDTIRQRQAAWHTRKQVTPPPILPPSKRVMGFSADAFLATQESDQVGNTLKGVGASAGRVTATARVLHGPEDFDQMKPGDVLVASITTPAWTPLFAMASAIVTDIGGPLSHGSIVAREYGIPAVLGTGVATRRIHSGETVTVDGGAGTVTLSRETGA